MGLRFQILMVTKVLPSILPHVVVASPYSEDARIIKGILDRYIRPFDVTGDGYDQFSSCTTGRFTFNLLSRYFETGRGPPTVFVSDDLEDGRGWAYGKSLTPEFYFSLGDGSMDPDPFFRTMEKDLKQIELDIGLQITNVLNAWEGLSPEQLRMFDIYHRCGEDWEKVERFLEYGKQITIIEPSYENRLVISQIAGLEDAIASYVEDPEDSDDSEKDSDFIPISQCSSTTK